MIEKFKQALINAHCQACFRENASTQVLHVAYAANGNNLIAAISAAMQCFGGKHAPFIEAYKFLKECNELYCENFHEALNKTNEHISQMTYDRASKGEIIPGFGSSFFRDGEKDPLLFELELLIPDKWTIIASRIRAGLLKCNKNLHPNLAFYTAVNAIEMNMPENLSMILALEGRVMGWQQYIHTKFHS